MLKTVEYSRSKKTRGVAVTYRAEEIKTNTEHVQQIAA
jgi:hypothetical protein